MRPGNRARIRAPVALAAQIARAVAAGDWGLSNSALKTNAAIVPIAPDVRNILMRYELCVTVGSGLWGTGVA